MTSAIMIQMSSRQIEAKICDNVDNELEEASTHTRMLRPMPAMFCDS